MMPSGVNRGFLEEATFEPGLKAQEEEEEDIKTGKTAPVKARREGVWHGRCWCCCGHARPVRRDDWAR